MPNSVFRSRVINNISYAIREARDAAKIEHPLLKGRIREIAAENIFTPMLPAGFCIGTGKICDQMDGQSSETDLIVYNRSILPPIMYSERDGIFPIESTYYSIEVKSRASAQEIKDSLTKARKTTGLYYLGKEKETKKNISLVVPVFFAYDSDLSTNNISELERYARYDSDCQNDPVIKAICVVGRGYWYHSSESESWVYRPPTKEYDEVIGLVSGIVNTLIENPPYRRLTPLGLYLI